MDEDAIHKRQTERLPPQDELLSELPGVDSLALREGDVKVCFEHDRNEYLRLSV